MKIEDTSFKNRYQNHLELMKGNEFASIMFIFCIINAMK